MGNIVGRATLAIAVLAGFAAVASAQTQVTTYFPTSRTYPVLSPDNRALIFSSQDAGGKLKIFAMDVTTKAVRQLTNGSHEDSAATFSADGLRIAFQREFSDGSRDIWIMEADGSNPRPVTTTVGISEQHPGFTSDGKSILFDSNRDADRSQAEDRQNFEIYMIDLSGGAVRRLTKRQGWDMYPTVSPDGRSFMWHGQVAGSGTQADFDVFVQPFDASAPRTIARSPAYDGTPAWHPRGDLVVFVSDRDARVKRRTDLFVADLETGEIRRATDGGGSDLAYIRPRFAPDGRSILVNRNLSGMIDIVRVPFSSE